MTTTAEVTGWVRPPPVAGLFYAADPHRLRDDVVRHGQDGDRHARDHDQCLEPAFGDVRETDSEG